MKSFKNKIVASVLAFTLVGGAFVINPNVAEAASKPLNIKKVLNLPAEGVTTPAEIFTFTFTGHSIDGDTTKAANLPKVSDVTIAYTADDKDDKDTKKDGKQLIKESADALANVKFTAAGQYTYTVVETKGNTKDMTYSQAEYLVSLFVKKVGEKYEVTDIQIKQTKNDKGEDVTQKKTGYQPGDEDDTTKDKNKFAFVNNYDKKDGNDNPTGGPEIQGADKKGFALRKTITDSTPDTNAEFTFNLTVAKPVGSNSDATEFKYFVVDGNGTAGTEQSEKYGQAFDVVLKHYQRIVFKEVLLGSKITFDETVAGAYTGSVKSSTFNGTAGTGKEGIIGDQAGGNFVEYENKTQTATGLLVDNLPFIALVAVAGAGIAFFVKNRKEEEALA
ncbi:Spy0128 family protein [Anaerococcus sp. Marseille-P3625]|uniref:Spy0128 family protein n=1 Tax=Anaerococcus sp. Marseille-P3625 TaxID=1977277 RepID=UPI000C074798|nr:FctA domain-containing protein [Anaerococcus sp. Marseille-P3625]